MAGKKKALGQKCRLVGQLYLEIKIDQRSQLKQWCIMHKQRQNPSGVFNSKMRICTIFDK